MSETRAITAEELPVREGDVLRIGRQEVVAECDNGNPDRPWVFRDVDPRVYPTLAIAGLIHRPVKEREPMSCEGKVTDWGFDSVAENDYLRLLIDGDGGDFAGKTLFVAPQQPGGSWEWVRDDERVVKVAKVELYAAYVAHPLEVRASPMSFSEWLANTEGK
jgi:hypothetical protein